ncbi:MAG: nucleotide sugar dehydrogenase [Candidatus Omnitrophica bacterium]|nr:nucleotide sugar dehydrogenase [Candidatus Omnitrophota bacterium]MDE2222410.1 nucleotide sugar dehydrogenase [Candidatus Omnitrophota bacterium]
MSTKLKNKILQQKARVAVIGLGYVGLPLALAFAEKGFKVWGIDTDQDRVSRIQAKKSYITDVPSSFMARLVDKKTFEATTDFDALAQADVVIICVPTPLKRKYTPDISYIVSAVRSLAKHVHKDMLVVLESTTYPGTTEELIKPELEKSGLKVGRDFYVAFSPERIDPGNKNFDVTRIPKVVGGLTDTCTELSALLYGQAIKHVHKVSTAKAAEMTKLLENSFRIVNIGWINEIARMCHAMGVNVWEVIDAAKTKPFGFMPFYPGLGVGGHCIPEDPLYLYWKAKHHDFSCKFIKLAADTNHDMPAYAVDRLKKMVAKPLKNAKVLVLGVTYKKDVKDLRKSPAIRLIELLKKQTKVDYYDPLIPFLKIDGIDLKAIALTPAKIKSYDAVIVAVDHTAVDYDLIYKNARRIFDTRNIYKEKRDKKVVKL